MIVPSPEARAALLEADARLADALAQLSEHEVSTFKPLRANIERNHIADKIKGLFAA